MAVRTLWRLAVQGASEDGSSVRQRLEVDRGRVTRGEELHPSPQRLFGAGEELVAGGSHEGAMGIEEIPHGVELVGLEAGMDLLELPDEGLPLSLGQGWGAPLLGELVVAGEQL